MKEKLSQDLSPEQIKAHPILQRVLQKMEEQMSDGVETTAHTVHNSHYSSLTKEEEEAGQS